MPSRSGRIHVATTRRTYNGRVYETHLLRRSFRDGAQVKHQTLGNISHLPQHLIELIKRGLAGETFVAASEAFLIERSLPHGHVAAILGTINKLGLDRILSSKRCRERDLVMAMIVDRLIHQSSKLGCTRLWHETTLAGELSLEDAAEDDLYAALDWLFERQARIERKLAGLHWGEGAMALYDVSSSYYYGRRCPLAQFGYSRDGKKGLPIIVYGLMTDWQGRPLAVEVYEGNRADPATVSDQVDKLRQRFKLSRIVLVGDRGMLTSVQIEKLKAHPGLGWISALRSRDIRGLMANHHLQPSLFDERNLAEMRSPEFAGEKLVACYNPLLADERKRKRGELLAATERAFERISKEVKRRRSKPLHQAAIGLKVGKVIKQYKMEKHFDLRIEEGVFEWKRNPHSISREQELDGIYVIRTSEQQMDASEVVRNYKNLAQVEKAFRSLKSIDLEVRPIRHRIEDHVRAHIFLCMLAYYVDWHMREALKPLLFADEELAEDRTRRDPVAPAQPSASAKAKKASKRTADAQPVHSFTSLLRALGTQCQNTCSIKADRSANRFHQITVPTELQAKAFALLGL